MVVIIKLSHTQYFTLNSSETMAGLLICERRELQNPTSDIVELILSCLSCQRDNSLIILSNPCTHRIDAKGVINLVDVWFYKVDARIVAQYNLHVNINIALTQTQSRALSNRK